MQQTAMPFGRMERSESEIKRFKIVTDINLNQVEWMGWLHLFTGSDGHLLKNKSEKKRKENLIFENHNFALFS